MEVGLRCIPAGVHRILVGAEGILVLLVEQREQLGFDCIVLVRDQFVLNIDHLVDSHDLGMDLSMQKVVLMVLVSISMK
jgi:hypothetical protein